MAKERIYIYTPDGVPVNDVEAQRAVDYATSLSFSSVYPRGYDACSFRLKRRDVFTGFSVLENFTVVVMDGLRLVWDGIITEMNYVTGGGEEYIDVTAAGWYELFNRIKLAKRWIDKSVLAHVVDNGNQNTTGNFFPHVTRRRNDLRLHMAPSTSDVSLLRGDYHKERYSQPGINNYIRRIELAYTYRTGEGVKIAIYNVDNGAEEATTKTSTNSTPATDTFNLTLTGGNTTAIDYRIGPGGDNLYDYNDYIEITTAVQYAHYESSHSQYDNPSYTLSELVEDCILMARRGDSRISADFAWLQNISVALDVFTIEKPTAASSAIDQLAAYGTASYETICFSVWGRDGTSDNLPRPVLDVWDNSDYEYLIDIDAMQLQQFTSSRDVSSIANYIWLSYVQADGVAKWLSPEAYPGLMDAGSIDRYGRIDAILEIGKANSDTQALGIGYRYLEYHKDARYRGQFTIAGMVQTKGGGYIPAAWVNAGQRVYVPQLEQIFVMRAVSYDAETARLTITPDLPPEQYDYRIAELKREMDRIEPASEAVG